MAPYRVRFDLPAGSKHNPIHIDDEDQGTAAARETSPESMSEEPTHGLPLGVSQDDDQVTVSTEVATPPPSLTEDMAEGTLHRQSPGIGQDQERKITVSGVPSGVFGLFSMNRVVLLLIDKVQNISMPPLRVSIGPENPLSAFSRARILPIVFTPSSRMRSRSLSVHLDLPLATIPVAIH
jgi:hypothetical protein